MLSNILTIYPHNHQGWSQNAEPPLGLGWGEVHVWQLAVSFNSGGKSSTQIQLDLSLLPPQ